MDFKTFLDLVLAIEHIDTYQATSQLNQNLSPNMSHVHPK